MKNHVFILLILLSGPVARAQDWFSHHSQGESLEGFIITITGDTLTGSIKYDYPVIMQKRISFDTRQGQNSVIYQPKDIRGYSCAGKFWESSNVVYNTYRGPVTFQRFGILYHGKGPIHLIRIFSEKDKYKKNISSSKAETIYKKISLDQDARSFRDLYLKKFEDPAESVNSSSYKKDFITAISRKVSDDKEIMDKINNKEYKYDDLIKIIDEYNNWYLQGRYK